MGSRSNSYMDLVDDDDSVYRSLGRLLRTAGFQPVAYASADIAIRQDLSRRFIVAHET
jgi:FixJ family two-component response regulator